MSDLNKNTAEAISTASEEIIEKMRLGMLERLGLKPTNVTQETFEKIGSAAEDLLKIAEQAGFAMFLTATARTGAEEGNEGFGLLHSHVLSEAMFDEETPLVVKMMSAVARTEDLMRQGVPYKVHMEIAGNTVMHIEMGEEDYVKDPEVPASEETPTQH